MATWSCGLEQRQRIQSPSAQFFQRRDDAGAVVDHQRHRQRQLLVGKGANFLFLPVFENAKILLLQIADGAPVFIVDAYIHQHQVDVHFKGGHTRRCCRTLAARRRRRGLRAQSRTHGEQQKCEASEFCRLLHRLS